MMKTSKQFEQYNFREYSKRRVKEGFKENKNLKDKEKVQEFLEFAKDQLGVLERQSQMSKFYKTLPLVIEKI